MAAPGAERGRLSAVTVLAAAAALCAFAGNSLLTRAALGAGTIDAAGFTGVRLASGALVLLLLARAKGTAVGGSWWGALALAGYAALFSLAYLSLGAATGALLLFGAVQCTMLTGSFLRREARSAVQWVGFALSLGGLVVLLLPGVESPKPLPALLMIGAGVCWGGYSLLGTRGGDPLGATAGNFLRAAPLVVPWVAIAWSDHVFTARGLLLAVVSGAVTSGLGYALWYRVLPGLGPFRAAAGQLAVPMITALAGVLLLSEPLTARLVVLELVVLGGVALALFGGRRRQT